MINISMLENAQNISPNIFETLYIFDCFFSFYKKRVILSDQACILLPHKSSYVKQQNAVMREGSETGRHCTVAGI